MQRSDSTLPPDDEGCDRTIPTIRRTGTSHGWAELDTEAKTRIIAGISTGQATPGPSHLELDLSDRCNAACYFCNSQDLRTRQCIPLPRIIELLDELAQTGLRSVRLAGGGDPLAHPEIEAVLEHLARRSIVVDNLTTNGIGLTSAVAGHLVDQAAREVIVSLNAADPDGYSSMMGVKPAIFERVLGNIRRLISLRGDRPWPAVVVQFLLDRNSVSTLPQLYAVGCALGVDRIAVNLVIDIPNDRIARERLLEPDDIELIRPLLREVLAADRKERRLQLYFPIQSWNEMVQELEQELATEVYSGFVTAPAFCEENGQCFFSWYSATISGSGNVYPCCLLLNPGYRPLGNILERPFQELWHGPAFTRMRAEQRNLLLVGGAMEYRPALFKVLAPPCVLPNKCWLKNLYFRGDEQFYHDLGNELEHRRRREVRWLGTPPQMIRKAEALAYRSPRFNRIYSLARRSTSSLRRIAAQRLGINLLGG